MIYKNIILKKRFAILIFIFSLGVYFIFSNHKPAIFNHHVYLADALLHQRLDIINPPTHHNDVALFNNKIYSIYGLPPAILLLPLVSIWGLAADEAKVAILIGAFNVFLVWQLLKKLDVSEKNKIWLTLFFAFGTLNFFSAVHDQTWWFVYLVVELFLLASLLALFTRAKPFWVGLFIGLAFLTRPEAIFALILPLVFLNQDKINFNKILSLFLGFAPSFLLFSIYNYIRFGNVLETGYGLFIMSESNYFTNLKLYGLFSLRYLPFNFYTYFLKGPDFVSQYPYVVPPWMGMSIFLISPAFLLALRANYRNKIAFACLLVVLLMALPSLLYYLPGWTEFGWKHSVMFTPYLMVLIAFAVKRKFDIFSILLIIISFFTNLWGVLLWKLNGWFY